MPLEPHRSEACRSCQPMHILSFGEGRCLVFVGSDSQAERRREESERIERERKREESARRTCACRNTQLPPPHLTPPSLGPPVFSLSAGRTFADEGVVLAINPHSFTDERLVSPPLRKVGNVVLQRSYNYLVIMNILEADEGASSSRVGGDSMSKMLCNLLSQQTGTILAQEKASQLFFCSGCMRTPLPFFRRERSTHTLTSLTDSTL